MSTLPTSEPDGVQWPSAERQAAFERWLADMASRFGLLPASLRAANQDASFRRYLRINTADGSQRIIMDAPPEKENCKPFVQVAQLMHEAGLMAPEVLHWDAPQGFLLLTDLGNQTMMDGIDRERPMANLVRYEQATTALVQWQLASRPGVLPPYDAALLRRELSLFSDWYVAQHKGLSASASQQDTLQRSFEAIIARNLATPSVYVHRDFMPRNLMLTSATQLGVLDFQDAVYGSICYDIASLMRDAFLTWDEEFVLEVTARYWEKAKKAGLMNFEDWASDFGSFYRAVEWMGLQRHLKVAGIFARLTLRDGKPKYLADAPRFIAYISATCSRYGELKPLLKLIDGIEDRSEPTGWAYGRMT